MIATIALTPAAAKRLIARGLINTPEFARAYHSGRIIISVGTTNAYIAEELGLLAPDDKVRFAAGIVNPGIPCATAAETRLAAICLEQGALVDKPWEQFLTEFERDDVFIKGANALDSAGNTAILLANPLGGTIGTAFGVLAARGSRVLIPVGHEKMIPSCPAAAQVMGISRMDDSMGLRCGLVSLPFGRAYTEIDALDTLFGIQATVVAAGGTGGGEGSVMLALHGGEDGVVAALSLAKGLLKEKALRTVRQACKDCFMETKCYIHQ